MNWTVWKKSSGSLKLKDNFPGVSEIHKPKEQILGGPALGLLAPLLASAIGVSVTVANIIISVAMMALSFVVSMVMKPKPPKLSGSMMNELNTLESGGTLVNTRSVGEVVRVIYGTVRTGGNIVFMHSKAEDNKALHLAVT